MVLFTLKQWVLYVLPDLLLKLLEPIEKDASFIEPGVILQSDGTYRANDVPVKSMQDYWGHVAKSSNNEGNIFDASYVKLRELNFSYSFPRKWFRSFFVKSLDLGFELVIFGL